MQQNCGGLQQNYTDIYIYIYIYVCIICIYVYRYISIYVYLSRTAILAVSQAPTLHPTITLNPKPSTHYAYNPLQTQWLLRVPCSCSFDSPFIGGHVHCNI